MTVAFPDPWRAGMAVGSANGPRRLAQRRHPGPLGRATAAHALLWTLFGAQSALLSGASRLTADVDVPVHLGSRSTRTFTDALRLRDLG